MPFAARRVARRTARRTSKRQSAAAPPPEAVPEAAAPAAADPAEPAYMAELEQLNELKATGVITADDYEAKKKQILGL